MRKWLQHWMGKLKDPPQAHLLFVDGENSPPPPDLLIDAVNSHANSDLELSLAYGKWWPNSNHTKDFREAGIECIQADEGSNNADIMLSLRALKEVSERAGHGQGGIAYVAFFSDKGFSHLLREIRITKGWKSVYVTSNEDPPSILVKSASEVLYVPGSDKPKPTLKKDAAPPNKKQLQQISEEEQPDSIPVAPFPQVDGFNNSSGLALPREPSDTALVITQLPSAISLGLIKTTEIKVPIQEATGLPSTRIGKVIRYSLRDYFSMNQNDAVTLTTHPNQTQLFECLKRTIMEKTRRQQNPEDMAIIKEYFSRVEEILTAQSLEESTVWSPPPKKCDKFEDMILELIGKEQINSHTLSSRIIAYQKAHDWEETGKRAINQEFGFPLNRSYKLSIEKLLPERVEISGDAPRYDYRVKNELSLEEE